MLVNINNWLSKPYSLVSTIRQKILISLVFGKIVFLFFYVFKPYAIQNLESGLVRNALIFGLITFILSLISFLIFPFIFKKYFDPINWTTGKMSLFYLYISLLISSVNGYYSFFFLSEERQLSHGFTYYFFSSFIISFSVFVLYIFLNERKNNKRFSLIAKKLSKIKNELTSSLSTENISFKSDIENEYSTFLIKDLVYIELQQNKTKIFYRVNETLQQKTLLISKDDLENQIKGYDYLIHCHPSYIINRHQISHIDGNARGYFLKASGVDFLIPVSRNFPKEFLYTLVK